MEQIAKPEISKQRGSSKPAQLLVFLDANVIGAYLQGDPAVMELFAAEAQGLVRFAVNPVVLQELLLTTDLRSRPDFEKIREHLEVLPIDVSKAEALLSTIKLLRNRVAHSNEILILSSAEECDFLVTKDSLLKHLVTTEKPQVVTPEEFATYLRAA